MISRENNGVVYFQYPHLNRFKKICHGIFTRKGGVSRSPYDSLNTALNSGDSEKNVLENRTRITECLGGESLFFIRQTHSRDVVVLKKGADNPQLIGPPEGDAVVTDIPRTYLAIQTADCQSVLLYDAERQVIANIHSGWRGSVKNIIGQTLHIMTEEFQCRSDHIHAGIGPSLGPCCAEFINYRQEIPEPLWAYKDSRDHFDFWQISRMQLQKAGVPESHISTSGLCTRCRTDLFFSYRAESATGRFMSVIGLT